MKRIISITLTLLFTLATPSMAQTLMNAIGDSDSRTAVRLINEGANLNVTTEGGSTALILASELGLVDVVEAMITKNVDVNQKSEPGYTALMLAADNGHAQVVKVLLNAGADVTAKSKTGFTALSLAKDSRNSEVVEILRNAGAN